MIRRRAFNLVEMIVAMSAGSALMLVAIGGLQRSMKLESASRSRAESARSLSRLAEQFRDDVHAAQTVALNAGDSMEITLPDGSSLTYRASHRSISRWQLLRTGQTRRESFKLGESQRARFARQDDPHRAVVLIERDTGQQGAAPRIDRHIAAVVGMMLKQELSGVDEP